MFAPRSKPDSVLSLLFHFFASLLSFLWKQELLNGMPLQAVEKAVFLPQWMFTQDRQLEGERLSGRAEWGRRRVVICAVGGMCSVAYEQLWAVFDKLPCLEIRLALKGLVL